MDKFQLGIYISIKNIHTEKGFYTKNFSLGLAIAYVESPFKILYKIQKLQVKKIFAKRIVWGDRRIFGNIGDKMALKYVTCNLNKT